MPGVVTIFEFAIGIASATDDIRGVVAPNDIALFGRLDWNVRGTPSAKTCSVSKPVLRIAPYSRIELSFDISPKRE